MGAFQIDYVRAHESAPVFREINFARLSDNMIDDIALRGISARQGLFICYSESNVCEGPSIAMRYAA
jgi:hypothetical protein